MVARDEKKVDVVTIFDVMEPILELSPGQGASCGSLQCHKYASCSVTFGNVEEPLCLCPQGFSG